MKRHGPSPTGSIRRRTDQKHFVAHPAARRRKCHPCTLLGCFWNLIVTAKRFNPKLLYTRGGTVNLHQVANPQLRILYLHLRDLRLEKIVQHDAGMALHLLCERIRARRELFNAGTSKIQSARIFAVEEPAGALDKRLG